MADNITLNAGTGGKTLASKDIGSVQYQRFIMVNPSDGSDSIPLGYKSTATLLNAVTATGAGTATEIKMGRRTYQAVLTGSSGTYSATVTIQGCLDNSNWVDLWQFVLSGTTTQTDADTLDERFTYIRGNVTAISGTGATVNLYVSA